MAFKNILLFGAGGSRIGGYILEALIADGSFNVTVLTRESSKATYPAAVRVKRVPDDFPHAELVEALRGQNVVVSCIGYAAIGNEYKLVDAAIEASVQRFIPSEWGMDNADVNNQKLNPIFKAKAKMAGYLQSKQSASFSWTAVATSIWLEWALDVNVLGIDPKAGKVQYWRDGTHAFSCTTLQYCGSAVAALLKHPDTGRNQRVFLSPFEASQRQIVAELESLMKVKFTTAHAEDEKIVKEAQRVWEEEKDLSAAYQLVTAGVLLPSYKSGFESSGKEPILEKMIVMPKLTMSSVVAEVVGQKDGVENGSARGEYRVLEV